MFCSKCGAENPEGTKVCSRCGAELGVAVKAHRAATAFGRTLGTFIALAVGLLLIAIGALMAVTGKGALEVRWAIVLAGIYIFVVTPIWGALFLEGQGSPVRVMLLVIALATLILSVTVVPTMLMEMMFYWP